MCSPKPPSSLLLISTLSEAENVADHVLLCRLRRLAPVVTIEGGGLMMWLREENRRLRMERDILKKAMACVLDAYSRRIVGWSMSDRMKQDLVLDALRMALGRRQPDQEAGLLHHSDRGSQYASAAFQQLLQEARITCSMSRRGNCWDNAMMESFFAILKKERIH